MPDYVYRVQQLRRRLTSSRRVVSMPATAVRRVVELHSLPQTGPGGAQVCWHCHRPWPCETIGIFLDVLGPGH
jgi:hypothetical protein